MRSYRSPRIRGIVDGGDDRRYEGLDGVPFDGHIILWTPR
jgi:hypothetical protein